LNESSTTYPFAIYESLDDAKKDSEIENGQSSRRRNRRRRGASGVGNSKNMDATESDEKEETLEDKSYDEQVELLRFGSSDPSIPVSKVPCSGCGAHLHCQDSKLPGFMPYEVFTKSFDGKKMSNTMLRKTKCQRCVVLDEYNVALKMNKS